MATEHSVRRRATVARAGEARTSMVEYAQTGERVEEDDAELQGRRREADHNPLLKLETADALLAVQTARSALRRLDQAQAEARRRPLLLLAFPPR